MAQPEVERHEDEDRHRGRLGDSDTLGSWYHVYLLPKDARMRNVKRHRFLYHVLPIQLGIIRL